MTRTLFVSLLAALPALAQSAGGFSAGPGLAPPSRHEEPAPQQPQQPAQPQAQQQPARQQPQAGASATGAAPAGAESAPEFRTSVTSYRPSPAATQVRQFATSRMWVIDPGQVTVEQWFNGGFGEPRAAPGPNQGSLFLQTEVELGIAKHLQLDLYFNYQFGQDGDGNYHIADGGHTGVAAELRYAIPDYWGQIWGNPTLYFELQSQYYNSPRAEVRLLLGGEVLTPKLLGALNLLFERNIFRDRSSGIDYELKASAGLNYEIVPDIFRVGIEGVAGFDSHGQLGHPPGGVGFFGQDIFPVLEAGPSLVLMEPHRRFKVLATLLFGLADYDQPYQPTVILSSAF